MDFTNALTSIFKSEGGFSENAADRGGATNFGISSKANPDVDVKNLTKEKAADIYKARYWDPIGADRLPDDMKLVAFDTAVQHGVGAAKQMIEASGGDTSKIIAQRDALYKNIVENDPSQAQFANGWSNRLKSLVTAPPETSGVHANLAKSVAALAQAKLGDEFILQKLSDAGHADEIAFAKSQGFKPDEIVAKFGGEPLAKARAAQAKVDAQGFGTNVVKGASNAVTDVSTGAKQLAATVTRDESRLQQLNADEATRQADPEYQAQANTVGSTIGSGGVKALPYLGAAALTGGASIPAQMLVQGAAGVASGALKPTTGDGQRLGNALVEGGLGAAGGGAGALIGKSATGTAAKLLGGNAETTALKTAAEAQGLPVNAASLSPRNGFWRSIADSMPENGSVRAFQDKADQAIAGKVADGLGLKGYSGAIDTDMLKAAEPGIKAGLDNATSVSVTLPQTLKIDLVQMVKGSANPLTEGIATNSVVKRAAANLIEAADSGAPIAGRQLQELNSELKALMQTQGISHSEKQIAGTMIGKINKTLEGAMTPDQVAAYRAANGQYANMKAVENMVRASNDTGVVLPRQMLQAVKTGRFRNAFLDGEAPFQELAGTASELYGPASGKGLASVLAKATNNSNGGFEAAALLSPHVGVPAVAAKYAASKLLGKLATSENPTIVRLLSGAGGKGMDPAIKKYITQALSGAGGAVAQP